MKTQKDGDVITLLGGPLHGKRVYRGGISFVLHGGGHYATVSGGPTNEYYWHDFLAPFAVDIRGMLCPVKKVPHSTPANPHETEKVEK